MTSHLDIDDYVIDQDTLLPGLYTAGIPEFEAQPDMHPERLDTNWFLAYLESWDWTADHEATAGRIATTAGSTSNCLLVPESDRIPVSPYLPWHHNADHGGDLLGDSVVRLGGAVTDANNESIPLSLPFGFLGISSDAPDIYTLTPDDQDHQDMEEDGNMDPQGANLNREARCSGSGDIVLDCEHAVFTTINDDTPPTVNPGDIQFRVETKRVYVCMHVGCNKKYSRMPDLRRHYRGSHLQDRRFTCRAPGCERAVRGFPRRDKRDVHEKKMHIGIGNGVLL